MGQQKVSKAGTLYLPAALRSTWLKERGTDYIQVTSLEQEGFLAVPDGVEWKLFEHYYPESDLTTRALARFRKSHELKAFSPTRHKFGLFKAYKVNPNGHFFSVPSKLLRSWDMELGGVVKLTDLGSGFLGSPHLTTRSLGHLVPEELLINSGWENEDDRYFRPALAEAYRGWIKEMATNLWGVIYDGGVFQGVKSEVDSTLICKKFGQAVVRDVICLAASNEYNGD